MPPVSFSSRGLMPGRQGGVRFFGSGDNADAYTNDYSLLFDGVDEYLNGGDVHGFERTDAFTASIWVRFNSLPGLSRLVDKGVTAPSYRGWSISAEGSALVIVLRSDNATANDIWLQKNSAFATGQWYHVVLSYDGSSTAAGCDCYIDRVLQTMTVNRDALSGTIVTTSNFGIGAAPGRGDGFCNAYIDEVSLWDVALSQSEINELASSGSPANLAAHSQYTNLRAWYRMGDPSDSIAASGVLDRKGTAHLTPINMEAGDIAAVVAP